MRQSLHRLIRVGLSWLSLLWLYLSTGWQFWRWRFQLWRQRSYITEGTQTGMKQTLLFIRHGQTTWNVENRLPGHLPGIPLTDKGREQAADLAKALQELPISAVISSPLERARSTAEYIVQGRDLAIQVEPDLIDTNVGHWAGENYKELTKNDPQWRAFVKDPTVGPEDVETFPQVQVRAVAAVERWRIKEASGAYLAFVVHADIVKLLIAHYTGLDTGRAGSIFIENASVSIVELEDEHRPRMVAIGWSLRPGWLKPPTEQPTENNDQPKGSVE